MTSQYQAGAEAMRESIATSLNKQLWDNASWNSAWIVNHVRALTLPADPASGEGVGEEGLTQKDRLEVEIGQLTHERDAAESMLKEIWGALGIDEDAVAALSAIENFKSDLTARDDEIAKLQAELAAIRDSGEWAGEKYGSAIDAAQAAIDKCHDDWKVRGLVRKLAESMCAEGIKAYDRARDAEIATLRAAMEKAKGALKGSEAFIEDELECRESSMLGQLEHADEFSRIEERYVTDAREVLALVRAAIKQAEGGT